MCKQQAWEKRITMVAYNWNIPECSDDSYVRFDEGDCSSMIASKSGSLLHRTILTIICIMSALCAVGAVQKNPAKKPVPRKTSFTESELRTLAKATPDENNAGLLYTVAIATSNNVERKQEYLKVAAACLIACDKEDVYTKYVKGKLLNATEFEAELKDDCKQCSGTGTKKNRCYACKGSGQCSVCKGSGQTKTVKYGNGSFNKYYELKPCSKCKESGRCQRCDGEGTTNEKCWTCAGTGKAFSKTVAARVFHDSCNAIANGMDVAATSNKVDVSSRVNLERRHMEQQSVAGELSQRRSRRGRKESGSVRTSEALPTSSGYQMDNKTLGQLKNLRQRRYSLNEVVSVGKALLLTSKISREDIQDDIRGTPFQYYGPDNEQNFKKEVGAIVESAQTLLLDIVANKTEIVRGEFNPEDYIEYWHRDATEIRKRRLFDKIWENALYSPHIKRDADNNPLGLVLLSKVPDNMVFVVDDVSLVELRGGGNVYCVKLTALVFGKRNYTLGTVWNGRKYQTEQYVELAIRAGALASRTVRLYVPTSDGDVEKWKKGDTVISKGWLNEWNIFNAVRTGNGGKEEYREITMPGEMFRSLLEHNKMNGYESL